MARITRHPATKQADVTSPTGYNLFDTSDQISLVRDNDDIEFIKSEIRSHLHEIINKNNLGNYKTILLYDDHYSISSFHSNNIYTALTESDINSDIFMIILSDGGKIEPAYLISKTCKRLTNNRFIVAIPRKAKSAATLIALGADELHMGLLSELGPIDPQFGGYPALGLSNALDKLAELATKFPCSSDMFAKYLTENLNLRDLGYFERINESAAQYAERLLDGKTLPEPFNPESLAKHFANHYKDHSFVIDTDEATKLLGTDIIKINTPEYLCANSIYSFLNFMDLLLGVLRNKCLRYVGSIENGIDLNDKQNQQ